MNDAVYTSYIALALLPIFGATFITIKNLRA